MTETQELQTPISFRLPTDQVKYLKQMSHYVSIERNADLSYVDLIREAIEQVYPMPLVAGIASENENHGS